MADTTQDDEGTGAAGRAGAQNTGGTAAQDDAVAPRQVVRRRQAVGLVAFLLLALLAGGLGSLLQGDDVGARYLDFERPLWAPPSWAFGVVWPVLYVLIGVAAWQVWRRAGGVGAAAWPLGLWLVQLVLNAAWPGVFFGVDALWAAAAVIAVLDIVVVATVVAFARVDRIAAALLLPYLAWILYATALNVAIAALN